MDYDSEDERRYLKVLASHLIQEAKLDNSLQMLYPIKGVFLITENGNAVEVTLNALCKCLESQSLQKHQRPSRLYRNPLLSLNILLIPSPLSLPLAA